MVVGRAIRATGCASCRLSLLRTFSSVAGIPIRPPQAPARFSAYNVSTKARYSSRVNPDDQHEPTAEQPIKVSEQEVEDFLKEEGEEDTVSYKALAEEEEATDLEISNVPWYLQVESPQKAQRTLSDRQRIPELPESPPEILEPLLQQISVDLGLDDLTLLDLRKLDPPPALGSNLIMVIGTARSEKHLHVSADRLCRWLRSTYKLRPDADGLLGRNELKLKLKRKSRRAKLMGNTQADETDDGVRTGWVCVNVGVVEGAKVEVEAPAENAGFVGFGRRTDGISIVVQMLTEEKRTEIDLEKLWGGILRRGTQQLEDADGENAKLPVFSATESAQKKGTNSSPILSQTRKFHTSARDRSTETSTTSLNETSSFPGSTTLQSRSEAIDSDRLQEHVLHSISNGDYEIAMDAMIKYCATNPDVPIDGWRPAFLDMLRVHLESSSQEFALQQLGSSSKDYTSTLFLKSFYQSLSTFPSQSEWEARIWLHCLAREVGHEGYTIQDLLRLLAELQLSAGQVGEATYLRALYSLLLPVKKRDGPHPHGVEGAMRLLQTMYDRGRPIISQSVFMAIIEATAKLNVTADPTSKISNENPKETFGLPDIEQPPIQERAHILMGMLDFPSFPEESRIRLLDIYARQQTWLAFWDTFRMPAREGKPRSAAMYACMFKNVALARNQAACMNVLRKWVPEMEQEEPSVALDGEIRLPVMACMKIADPLVEQDAADPESKSEWVTLWRKCVEDVRHEA